MDSHGGASTSSPVVTTGAAAAAVASMHDAVALQPGTALASLARSFSPPATPESITLAYERFIDWTETVLDKFRGDIEQLLWPVFFHSYVALVDLNDEERAIDFLSTFRGRHNLAFAADIDRLARVAHAPALAADDHVQLLKKMAWRVSLSEGALETVEAFLVDNKLRFLAHILDMYVKFLLHRPSTEQNNNVELAAEQIKQQRQSEQAMRTNQQPVLWAVQLEELTVDPEEEAAAAGGGVPEQTGPGRKRKIDEAAIAEREKFATYSKVKNVNAPADDRIPTMKLPFLERQRHIQDLRQVKDRMRLDRSKLPSTCFYTFLNVNHTVNAITMNTGKTTAATAMADGRVRLWALTGTDALVPVKNGLSIPRHSRATTEADIHDQSAAKSTQTLLGHCGAVYDAAFSVEGRFLVSSGEDRTSRLWSMDTFTNVAVFRSHNTAVWCNAFSPLGMYFATGGVDRTARLWSVEHPYPLRVCVGHTADVDSIVFHPNGNYFATGSSDNSCRLWDVLTGECVRVFEGVHQASVLSLAVSPCGRYLASGAADASVALWDINAGTRISSMLGHDAPVYSLAFSRESSLLVSGSGDCTVRMWDVIGSAEQMDEHGTGAPPVLVGEMGRRETPNLVGTYHTKATPVHYTDFTNLNLLMAAGPFSP